jgi:hypothetical protein
MHGPTRIFWTNVTAFPLQDFGKAVEASRVRQGKAPRAARAAPPEVAARMVRRRAAPLFARRSAPAWPSILRIGRRRRTSRRWWPGSATATARLAPRGRWSHFPCAAVCSIRGSDKKKRVGHETDSTARGYAPGRRHRPRGRRRVLRAAPLAGGRPPVRGVGGVRHHFYGA